MTKPLIRSQYIYIVMLLFCVNYFKHYSYAVPFPLTEKYGTKKSRIHQQGKTILLFVRFLYRMKQTIKLFYYLV